MLRTEHLLTTSAKKQIRYGLTLHLLQLREIHAEPDRFFYLWTQIKRKKEKKQ